MICCKTTNSKCTTKICFFSTIAFVQSQPSKQKNGRSAYPTTFKHLQLLGVLSENIVNWIHNTSYFKSLYNRRIIQVYTLKCILLTGKGKHIAWLLWPFLPWIQTTFDANKDDPRGRFRIFYVRPKILSRGIFNLQFEKFNS